MWNFLIQSTPLVYLTQSVWRDEAFSILLAQRSPAYFIPRLTFEPPAYYLLLHYWMKLFGTSEIAARSLSLVGFVLATVVVIEWAEKLFKKHWLAWFLPAFFFFNPMLLYYAFEIRAYGWYMFFAVASMYAYMAGRPAVYVAVTVLGIYTHSYMIIVPAVQVFHYLLIYRKTVFTKKGWQDRQIRAFAAVGLFVSPWLAKVAIDLPRLSESWYYPVDMQLAKSVLGNIFLGYEGTPVYLWKFTAGISLLFIAIALFAVRHKQTRARNGFFFLLAFVPLITILTISWFKPLFVSRYFIPATIAQIFLIVFALELVRNKLLQKLFGAAALAFVVGFNLWYPSLHAKKNVRSVVYEINALTRPDDVILTDNPLILFETLYYSKTPSRVFWYNPKGEEFPWYIGDIVFSPKQVTRELPPYPIRAFIIHNDLTFEISYNTAVAGNNP